MKDQPTAAASPLEELTTLFPVGRDVDVFAPCDPADAFADRPKITIHVRALSAREIVAVLAGITPLIGDLEQGKSVVDLVSERFEEVVRLASAATNQPADTLASLDGGDFLAVAVAVFFANESFFRRAGELVFGATGARIKNLFGVGPTPSSTLPATV